jgi:hypothetical protein
LFHYFGLGVQVDGLGDLVLSFGFRASFITQRLGFFLLLLF